MITILFTKEINLLELSSLNDTHCIKQIKCIDSSIISNLSINFSSSDYSIISSINAIRALVLNNITPTTNILAVGEKTAQTIIKVWGICPKIIAPDATSLIQKINSNYSTQSFIYFCGTKRLAIIPDFFSVHSTIKYQEAIIYKTQLLYPNCPIIYKQIVFFSPSGVKSFLKNNTILSDCTIFALGTTTQKTLELYGYQALIPLRPNLFDLVALIKSYTKNNN